MKKKIINISLLLCFLFLAVFSLAAEEKNREEKSKNVDAGANKKEIGKDEKINSSTNYNRFTIYAAYDGVWFSYTETLFDGTFLDSDEGWLSGGFIELRYDNKLLFVRLNSSIIFNAYAKYTGSLLFTGEPIIQRCVELISMSEINIGYKILNYKSFTLSPYNSFGYRFWQRYIGYTEDYTWFYAGIGINMEFDFSDWILGMDVSVDFPLFPRMYSYGFVYNNISTGIKYNVDKSTFVLQSIPGLKIELNIRFNIYSSNNLKVFIFGIPYYQLWNIGASRPVVQTQSGINIPYDVGTTYLYLYEPDSITHMGGIKFGFGINFL